MATNFDIEFYIDGVAITVISTLGLIGNAFIVITLSRPKMRSSINLLFLSLACFDVITLVCFLLLLGIPWLLIKNHLEELITYILVVHTRVYHVLVPVAYMAQTASTWTTISITIERYIAVCHPLKARTLCSYGKARICVLIVVALAFCCNIPEFLRNVPIASSGNNNATNVTEEQQLLGKNEVFSEVYDMWLYLVIMYVAPFVIFVTLNVLIFSSVRLARRNRRSLSLSMERDMSLLKMLVCVVTVYFLCNLMRIVYLLMDHYSSCCAALEDVSTAMVVLNSSVNFVIYYALSEKFRRSFLEIFCAPRYSVNRANKGNSCTLEVQTF